jgi:hypothetical protein
MGFVSDLLGGSDQGQAATDAANIQAGSSAAQVAESRRQFDFVQKLLAPFVNVGTNAVNAQGDLSGINGNTAQQTAIDGIQNGSQFQSMLQQGNRNILQNASATGGLRGGNTQSALAQFSPQLLNQLIQQQFSNYGGLTSTGANAAAGVGNASANSTSAINSAMQNTANAQAGAAITNGNTQSNTVQSVLGIGATLAGLFSDERLKSDVKRIGTHKKGFGIYEYIKFGKREVGVLAQEVMKVIPEAVKLHKSGYLMVNYSMLGA